MPQKPRQLKHLDKIRKSKGDNIDMDNGNGEDSSSSEDSDYLNEDIVDLLEETKISNRIDALLSWQDGAMENRFRCAYTGNSRTSKWRRKKQKEELNEVAKSSQKITSFFKPITEIKNSSRIHLKEAEPTPDEPTTVQMQEALKILQEIFMVSKSQQKEKVLTMFSKFQSLQGLAIFQYFKLILDSPRSKMEVSTRLSKLLFPQKSE